MAVTLTAATIADIDTYHATPGDTQNTEIRTALTAARADLVTLDTNLDARIETVSVSLTEANIVGMYTTAVEVVAAQGAGTVIEFVSATLIYDYDTAAYTGGGAIHVEYSGGAAISTTVAAANGFGAAGDKVFSMAPLNAAGGYTMPVNTALDITNATGVFVDPGTAAGVARIKVQYRVHTTGL